jgi:hypothetical protein
MRRAKQNAVPEKFIELELEGICYEICGLLNKDYARLKFSGKQSAHATPTVSASAASFIQRSTHRKYS